MIRKVQYRATQDVKGFQSPADDHLEGRLDITDKLVVDPLCTYYFLMDSNELNSAMIPKGALLILDRSLAFVHNAIVVFKYAGDFYCRRLMEVDGKKTFQGDTSLIEPKADEEVVFWGVVSVSCNNQLPKELRVGRYAFVCVV